MLYGYYTKVTSNYDWPENQEIWSDIGFTIPIFKATYKLEASGLSMFQLLFFSTFFYQRLKEMLYYSKQSPHQFTLAGVSFEITQLVISALRSRKLNKLIKANKKTIETIFYFYAGAFLC